MQIAVFLYLLKLILSELFTKMIGIGMELLTWVPKLLQFVPFSFLHNLNCLCRFGDRIYGIFCLRAIWIRNWWIGGFSVHQFEGVHDIFDENFTCFYIAASALSRQFSALWRTKKGKRPEITKKKSFSFALRS